MGATGTALVTSAAGLWMGRPTSRSTTTTTSISKSSLKCRPHYCGCFSMWRLRSGYCVFEFGFCFVLLMRYLWHSNSIMIITIPLCYLECRTCEPCFWRAAHEIYCSAPLINEILQIEILFSKLRVYPFMSTAFSLPNPGPVSKSPSEAEPEAQGPLQVPAKPLRVSFATSVRVLRSRPELNTAIS